MLRACVLSAAVAATNAAPDIGWPAGSVKHRFFDTPNGQIHYVVGGKLGGEEKLPLVLQHGHPRSTVEYKYLTQELDLPFLALDYFNMGMSEDYLGNGANDTFCSFEEFASYALQILEKERVTDFVAVGSLKGSHPTIELAAQAGQRVKHVVLINPLILAPQPKQYITNVFIPKLQNEGFTSNGSHVLAAWKDHSAAPVLSSPADLVINEEKTLDAIRCMGKGWQYDTAWVAYNDRNLPRMREVDAHARSLFLYGTIASAEQVKYGLTPEWSESQFASILTKNTTFYLDNGAQGMTAQNASAIASHISAFLSSASEPITV